MGATKIINVLKDDGFEELLDILKSANASEIVFVLPKKAKAFKSEAQFAALEEEIKNSDKSVAFLCSDPEINGLAKKYNFEVLSPTKTESSKAKPKPVKHGLIAVPVSMKNDDDIEDDEDGLGSDLESEKVAEEELSEPLEDTQDKENEKDGGGGDYKEEEITEDATEEDAPYGTELDESGDPIYDEEGEEETIGKSMESNGIPSDFQVIAASIKKHGMSDVVTPGFGKRLKIVQKDRQPIKIETRREADDDIKSVFSGKNMEPGFGWSNKSSDNIWADISKPRALKSSFFSKFKFSGKDKPKRGLEFKSGNFLKKRIVVLSVASILILAFVVFLTSGNARIEIKPKSQTLNTQFKVTISSNFSSVDNSFKRIPGQLFTINKSVSGEFNATAEKDAAQKSRGTVTIYNEYGTLPQPLVATTRFEYLKDGKGTGLVFRTLQTVIIPGMKVENGVVTPGKINVEVVADKAGQAYNVSSGNFGVVAWREGGDTGRYAKIYGKSSDSMRGGILGKAKVVSEFDYNNAKDNLTEKIKKDIQEALKTQSAGLELITDLEPKIDSVESTAKIDDAADMFTMTVNSSIITLGYKKEDLMKLIADHVEKTTGLMIVPDKLELSYKDASVDPTDNTLGIIITIGGNAYAKIDKEGIVANLINRNELQIKDYLSSNKDIDSAKVILSPFWVKKIPKNKDKIDISLTF